MLYKDLERTLSEYMKYGMTINLKSLINSIFLCDDIQDVRLTNCGSGFAYYSFNEIKKRNASYMQGYIFDCNRRPIFNNHILTVTGKDDKVKKEIWFGSDRVLSLQEGKNRYGEELLPKDYKIIWKTDNVYIVCIGEDSVDANIIFNKEG